MIKKLKDKEGEKIMKVVSLNFMLSMFLIFYHPTAKAMMDSSQEEERQQVSYVSLSPAGSSRSELSSSTFSEYFPDEILSTIFVLLEINDLGKVAQVSTGWKKVTENPDLWTYIGKKYYGDYLNEEDPRENARKKCIYHYLSVVVNATEDLNKIERLVNYYRLCFYCPPFMKGIDLIDNLITNFQPSSIEDLVAQGNRKAIEKKLLSLTEEKTGTRRRWIGQDTGWRDVSYFYNAYTPEYLKFNNLLVEKGDSQAIERKIMGLAIGDHGYEKDPSAAKELNDVFVEKEDIKAIERKIEGLTEGKYGYDTDLSATREFNELLIGKDYAQAIERKIEGLLEGKFGYEKNPTAIKEFNEVLVERGNAKAIERKIWGLLEGKFEYNKSPEDAKNFNDFLVEKGNPVAFERKFTGLYSGGYGYEKNLTAAREINELFVKRGDQKAIATKIIGLAEGSHTYAKDPEAAKIVIESLDAQNANIWKYHGLLEGKYGYEKDLMAAREFNELLVERDDPEATERKIKGLAEGQHGYKKDLKALRIFNDFLGERDDPEALVRKIRGLIAGQYGYEKDFSVAREFIESLLMRDSPIARAIGKYIKAFAMKYGVAELGYEKDREKAIEFIKENYVPY